MMSNPIKREIICQELAEDDDLSQYLEEVIKEIDDEETNNKNDKYLVNNEFFVISAISLLSLSALNLDLIDLMLIISLILLIVAILTNGEKKQDE